MKGLGKELQGLLIALLSLLSIYVAGVLVMFIILSKVSQIPLHLDSRLSPCEPQKQLIQLTSSCVAAGDIAYRRGHRKKHRFFNTEIITDQNT